MSFSYKFSTRKETTKNTSENTPTDLHIRSENINPKNLKCQYKYYRL